MSQNPYVDLADLLNAASQKIAFWEAEGRVALYENDDEDAYRALMRQKAELLAGLATAAGPALRNIDPEPAAAIRTVLEQFSQNAGQALALESVFYMAALLYPDDYQVGQLNNLDRLALEVTGLADRASPEG